MVCATDVTLAVEASTRDASELAAADAEAPRLLMVSKGALRAVLNVSPQDSAVLGGAALTSLGGAGLASVAVSPEAVVGDI